MAPNKLKSRNKNSNHKNKRKSDMQIQHIFSNIFKSRCILYALFTLAILNILGFLYENSIEQIAIFFAVGILTYFFTKNSIVILGMSVLTSNLLRVEYKNNQLYTRFGLKEGLVEGKQTRNKDKDDTEDFGGRGIAPKAVASDGGEDDLESSYIDKSKTIENAYASLDNMLGNDGMKVLSDETNKLIEKQNMLLNSIKSLGPVMQNVNGMMQTMGSFTGNTNMKNASKELESALKTFNTDATPSTN